ncbi:MAG: glyoxylate reductase [Colwellia sp.]|jgi:glyoxylate reductase
MKLFITRIIPDADFHKLESMGIEIDIYEHDKECPREILLKRVVGVDAILSQTDDDIDEALMEAAGSKLKVVANYGVGFENIDLTAAKKRNIIISNTPVEDAFDATAEATVALLTSVAKRITYLHWYKKVNNVDPGFSFVGDMGVSLRNKTCGIIGMGNIGSRVARMMHKGFNNKILYFDVPVRTELEQELSATKLSLAEVMQKSDFICINLPLLDSTKGLINKEMIDLMPNHSTIVSIARTGIIDDAAIVERINKGELHGAGLDIYTDAVDNFNEHANIALTSHLANLEVEAFSAMASCCVANLLAVLTGKNPINEVKIY